MVKEFIAQYGFEMIHAALMFIFGFIGIGIKTVIKNWFDDKTKRDIAMTVVEAMEQMYKDWTGSERFDEAVVNMSEMLEQKGIAATELEIKLLIESAVKEMNTHIKKTEAKNNADSEAETELS